MIKQVNKIIRNSIQFVLIIFVLVLFRSFLYEPFVIPSGSMKSTLLIGDYVIVSKYAYGYSKFSFPFAPPIITAKPRMFYTQPNRGDVVVFRGPRNPGTNYIKRVIGLPGDKIQLKDGVIYINNQVVKRFKVDEFIENQGNGEILKIDRYSEILDNGVSYSILQQATEGKVNNTSVYYVPDNHFFVMGDNRDNSTDSRFLASIGLIPAENLVGRAERVLISFGRNYDSIIPFKIRIERIWQNIANHPVVKIINPLKNH
jgi:signal peptidase I